MLLLHSDVFLTTGQVVLQWPLAHSAVLLHGDPNSPGARQDAWGRGGGREGAVGWGGEEGGKGAGGG